MLSASEDQSADDPIALRLWRRIPIVIRAVVMGVLVFMTMQLGQMILALNFAAAPEIPWVVPLVLLFLFVTWRYFAGAGWPTATRDARQRAMRQESINTTRLLMGYVAAVFVLGLMLGIAIVTSSLITFPEESFTPPSFIGTIPEFTSFAFILCFALVAGVSEEAGFRGYMQVPLEDRYGPHVAVLFVATLFWLAHYEHASFLQRMPLLLGAGIFAGYLAYYSRSLWPAIMVHFAADVIGFTAVSGLFGLTPLYSSETIWLTGATPLFWSAVILMLVCGLISIGLLAIMSRLKD